MEIDGKIHPWNFLGDMYVINANGRCSIVLLDVVEVSQVVSGGGFQ